ncbi:MAG: citrate lyase subunit alpha, partial [Methanobacteriota archaeon]
MSEDAETTCPVCWSANSREATSCGSCGYSLSDASRTDKVDALLDDLMDLSKAPPEITE